jgi:hypothetical protein
MTKSMQRIMMLLESAIHQVGLGDDLKVQENLRALSATKLA